MPRIREYQVSQSAQSSLPGPLNVRASAEDFGGQVGAALQGLGGSIQKTSTLAADQAARSDAIQADLLSAKLEQAATKQFFDEKQNAAPGGKGFADDIKGKFDDLAAKTFDGASDGTRQAARAKVENLKTSMYARALGFEAEASSQFVRNSAQDTLSTLQNTVALDPTRYESAIQNGVDLIDKLAPMGAAPGLPSDIRDEFKRDFIQKTTNDYFNGRLRSSKSAADVDGVLTELADPKFGTRLDPKDTTELLDRARTFKSAIGEQANAAARSSLDSLKSRMEAGDRIDPAELSSADKVVEGAANPTIINDWHMLRARQRALSNARTLPKGAVDDALAQEAGLPGRSGSPNYPGLPAELNQSVNLVTQATGGAISPDYAARTMIRESGGEIAKLRRGKPEFTPELPDSRPAIRDAAAVAGEIFGAKLAAKSAAGNALDIDVSSMKPEDKGRLADALVQAGFTGFAEYDDHLHVDFRKAVPGSFNSTDQFGGWSRLSPEVMNTLLKRGFKAGQASERIDRNGADGKPAKTGGLNFDFANPTSTARGPYQFTEQTWLDTLAGTAKKYGIDIAGQNRQALLAMRSDPKVAALVFADFTMANKKSLTAALGRDPNDAELYMAHFLGSGGAIGFIRAFQQQPNAAAADVVTPQALASNKSVFFNKDGSPKTVSDVYYDITGSFNNGVDQLARERVKAYQTVSDEMAGLAKDHGDPMTYAAKNGALAPAALTDAQSYAARGRQAIHLEDYYKLPYPKPLTNDEVASYKKRIEEGSVDDAVAALKELGQFGGRATEGAARQIGEQSEISAHLAGLFAQGGAEAQVAEDIIRGQRRITQDRGAKDWLGSNENGGTQRVFDNAVGSALDGADPKTRAAMKAAADAYYVQKFSTRDGTRDDAKYAEAVNATLGGRLGVVNRTATVLPKGVTSEQMDDAIDNLTQTDLVGLSVSGDAPVDAYGRQVSPFMIAVEGKFVHVGGNQYEVMLSDNKFLGIEHVNKDGLPLRYRMKFDTKSIAGLAARGAAVTVRQGLMDRLQY
ncbi:hypothetical protein RLW55_04070 [Hyphomicrobium sp. B1]|uniref:hypothetical protein n=1 Tax=Hyphomicrobium sp. B1 TaxID=3075651 RepID=UPI003C2E0E4B